MERGRRASSGWSVTLIAAIALACSESESREPLRSASGDAASAEPAAEAAESDSAGAGSEDSGREVDASDARGLPAGAIHVEPAVILDATGFERPLAASTLFLPRGWRAQGGVVWGQQFMCTNGYAIDWSASSPDGTMRIAVLPGERWEANNYGAAASTPGCPLAPYSDVRQYLEARAQRIRPDARIEGFRVREDLQQQLARFNAQTPMPMGEMRTWVEAGELALSFDEGGRAMRATLAAAAVFSLMRSNVSGMGTMDALTATTFPAWAASAPADRFDASFFEAIRRSIQPSPLWEARIGKHNAAIGRVAIEEARKRGEAISRSNDEIARIRNEAWEAQQVSADRRAREFGELIKGVETYDDADAPGGRAELDSSYDNAWRLDDGSYVLTNDASFEPWRDLGVEGKKLDATR